MYIFYVVHVHPHPRKFKISASNVYQCVTGFFKNPFVPSLAYDVYDTSNFVLFFQCRNSIGVFQFDDGLAVSVSRLLLFRWAITLSIRLSLITSAGAYGSKNIDWDLTALSEKVVTVKNLRKCYVLRIGNTRTNNCIVA